MKTARLLCSALLTCAAAVAAASGDVNNPTGTSGLIMVDKMGAIVRFFEPGTFKELSTLTISGTPHELAISPDRKVAYVPDYGDGVYGRNPHPGHTIAVIDLSARTVIGTIDVSPYQAPHGLQVDARGLLYASCDLSRKLLVIDPNKRSVIAAIDTEGTGHWAAVLPDGSKAYVANKADRPFVSVIDLRKRAMVGRVEMPKGTQGISASPDGRYVLALDLADPRIAVIDTHTDTVSKEIALAGSTKGAWRARYSPDGKQLLVTNVSDRTVSIFDAASFTQQRVVKTGAQPFGIAFTSDSKTALIGNHGDGTIDVIDLKSYEVAKSFKAGVGIEVLSYY